MDAFLHVLAILLSLAVTTAVSVGDEVLAPHSGIIAAENAKAGTRDWLLTSVKIDPATRYRSPTIEGYCSHASDSASRRWRARVARRLRLQHRSAYRPCRCPPTIRRRQKRLPWGVASILKNDFPATIRWPVAIVTARTSALGMG